MKKTAFITGASRGIGRETALLFAASGYDLYLSCCRRKDLLDETCKEIMLKYGAACTAFTGDIGSSDFVNDVFSHIPRLDVLINNAGISYVGLLHEMSDADWNQIISTNLSSMFYTSRQAIPRMLAAGGGRILNVSSVWGNTGASMEAAYSASKGAVNSLTRALAKELAPSNIQVNAAAFGVIDTQMNAHLSGEELEMLRSEIPADRIGLASEAAALLLQLAQAPSYLTGQVITMDGGWT